MTPPNERSVEEATRSEERHDSRDDLKSYVRFGAMIATAMVAMYVTTYVNTFTMSLDGFITDPREATEDPGRLHE